MTKKCKILVTDEVNCKILNLEAHDRRTLMKKLEFDVPGARYLPAVKLGRWNGKMSYFSVSGSTFVNLLPEIIPYLDSSGYDIELEDVRTYNTVFEFDPIDESVLSHKTWAVGHPAEGEPIMLRDYQVALANNFFKNQQSICSASTGSGKTILCCALSYAVEKYGRSIIIVPSKSLVKQTEEDYLNVGLDVGVFFGDRKDWNKTHTICTWQSLASMMKNNDLPDGKTISDFLEGVVCVICDEVHTAKGDLLKSMLTGIMSHIPIRWGLTGTIPKDMCHYNALLASIGPLVGELSAKELQDVGVLSNCHIKILQLQDKVDFRDYHTEHKFLMENDSRLDKIADLINDISKSGNTLILVDRIHAAEVLTNKLDRAIMLSGASKLDERKEQYDSVSESEDSVLVCTFGIASTGINIPRLFNVVLIEGGRSFTRIIQSVGRGLRTAKDKDFVNIYDITSSCKFSKRHLTERKAMYKEAQYPFSVEKINYK